MKAAIWYIGLLHIFLSPQIVEINEPESIEDIGTAYPFNELVSGIRKKYIAPLIVEAGLKVAETRKKYAKSDSCLKQTACNVALNPLNKWFEKTIRESVKD